MSTMLISWNGTRECGQFIGDTFCSLKVAWEFARAYPCAHYMLAMSPQHDMNFLWKRFIERYKVEVIWDDFEPGNLPARFDAWNRWRSERQIDGRKFDVYKELYRRVDGPRRQAVLCGGEKGLARKNIFEYLYYGQDEVKAPMPSITEFGDELIHHPVCPAERAVLVAPYAKCQGNRTFTFDYWTKVIHQLVEAGLSVTVNHDGHFCEDLNANPLYRKIFPGMPELIEEVCRHKLIACGNTGLGWVAGACGIPLLAMQPVDSNMQDYRYEWCGVKSLVEFMDQPDVDYCARRIMEIVNHRLVLTTGCYDVLHAGHIRHLEESRALGSKLVVALNSDESVKRMKGADRPYHKQAEREAVLRALRSVDDVAVFDGPDALPLIEQLRPMIVTNGPDHKLEEIVGKAFVEQYGGRAHVTSGTRAGPSTTKTLVKVVKPTTILKAIRDAAPLTPNPFAKLKLLSEVFESVLHVDGDVADLGAYKGACALIMRRMAPERALHVFDTWAGNPFDDELCHHKKGDWKADEAECRRVVGEGENVAYYCGVFPYSAEPVNGRQFAFAYLDLDTYQSTKDALEWFWPRLAPGGKLLVDDYGWEPCAGVRKAVDEAFEAQKRRVYSGCFACVLTKS